MNMCCKWCCTLNDLLYSWVIWIHDLLTIAEYWGNLCKYSRSSTAILSFGVFFLLKCTIYSVDNLIIFTLPKKIKERVLSLFVNLRWKWVMGMD